MNDFDDFDDDFDTSDDLDMTDDFDSSDGFDDMPDDTADDISDGFDDDFGSVPAPEKRPAAVRRGENDFADDFGDGFEDDFSPPAQKEKAAPPRAARSDKPEPQHSPAPRRDKNEVIPEEGPELREYLLRQDKKRKTRRILLSIAAVIGVFLSVWCTGFFKNGFMPWDIMDFKVGGAKVSDLFLISDPEALMSDGTSSGTDKHKEKEEAAPHSQEEDFVIEEHDDYCTVIGYMGTDKALRLPQTYKGKPVTEVGTCAFANISYTDIVIPEGYTTICQSAFSNCSVTDLSFPETVTEIGWGACADCYALEKIKLPSTLTSISDWAFASCPKLNNVVLPETVTVVGEWAFNNCASMTDLTLSPNITEIKSCAFYSCKSLAAIELPLTVKSIGSMAFRSCAGLKIIVIPDSVTTMGTQVFMNCDENLTLCGTKGGIAEKYANSNSLLYIEP